MIYLALFECFELRINLLKQSRQRREELRLMELKAFDLTLREVFLTNLTEVLYLNVLSSSDSVRVYMTVMRCSELKIV